MLKNVAINSAGIFSAAALALLPALLISYPILSDTQDTFADAHETDTKNGSYLDGDNVAHPYSISLSSDGFLLDILPSATGAFAADSVMVNVSTTNDYGYTLKMSTSTAKHQDNVDSFKVGSCSKIPVYKSFFSPGDMTYAGYDYSTYRYYDTTDGSTGTEMLNGTTGQTYSPSIQEGGSTPGEYYISGDTGRLWYRSNNSDSIFCFNINNWYESDSTVSTRTATGLNSKYFTPPVGRDMKIYSTSSAGTTSNLPINFGFKTVQYQTSGNYALEVKLTATTNMGNTTVTNNNGGGVPSDPNDFPGGGNGNSSGNTNTAYFVDSNNNPVQYMQQMTQAVCDAAPTPLKGATYLDINNKYIKNNTGAYVPATRLTDSRDGQNYLVAKLADGNCWMVEDLKTTKESLTSYGTTTLTSANTNMRDSNRTFSVASLPATATINADNSVTGWSDTATSSSIAKKAASSADKILYNWHAAVLEDEGTTIFNADNINVLDAAGDAISRDSSICPRGWRLPNAVGNRSWNRLLTEGRDGYEIIPEAQSNVSPVATISTKKLNKLLAAPLNFNYTGHIKGNDPTKYNHGSDHASYWTRTTVDYQDGNDNDAYSLIIDASNMEAGARWMTNNKKGGLAIRCVNSLVQ